MMKVSILDLLIMWLYNNVQTFVELLILIAKSLHTKTNNVGYRK